MGPVAAGNAFPAFIRSRYSGFGAFDDARADDGRRPAGGEQEVLRRDVGGFCFHLSEVMAPTIS